MQIGIKKVPNLNENFYSEKNYVPIRDSFYNGYAVTRNEYFPSE